jgi:hypothetical protein
VVELLPVPRRLLPRGPLLRLLAFSAALAASAACRRGLPDAAHGTEPAGLLLRSLVECLVAPLDRLAAVSPHAEIRDAALLLSFDIEAAPTANGKEAR